MNIIYGLINPITQHLRYIGYTCNAKHRFNLHVAPSKLKKNNKKNAWIKSLMVQGLKPEMIVLEIYENAEELPQAEIEQIAYYHWIGCDLTNGTVGGDGGATTTGKPMKQETKDKIAFSHKGKKKKPFSEEIKRAISERGKGRKQSPETICKRNEWRKKKKPTPQISPSGPKGKKWTLIDGKRVYS